MKIYKEIAGRVTAINNCIKSNNTEWLNRHEEELKKIIDNHAPHGSGFDSGTEFDLSKSNGNKLVFYTHFHHMNENGYYDGWTDHTITVIPDLYMDFNINISGRDRNDIKEYIHEIFYSFLDIKLTCGEIIEDKDTIKE